MFILFGIPPYCVASLSFLLCLFFFLWVEKITCWQVIYAWNLQAQLSDHVITRPSHRAIAIFLITVNKIHTPACPRIRVQQLQGLEEYYECDVWAEIYKLYNMYCNICVGTNKLKYYTCPWPHRYNKNARTCAMTDICSNKILCTLAAAGLTNIISYDSNII